DLRQGRRPAHDHHSARSRRDLHPPAHPDPHPSARRHGHRQVHAGGPLLHAPALRRAATLRAFRGPAHRRHRYRSGAGDADRRVPGTRTMIHLEALVLVAALAGAWLAAWWASGADETIQPARVARLPLPRAQAAAFFGGLLALTAALNGPLHDLAERSLVSAHMIQHLLLVLVVAPCLLAGALPVLLDRVLAFRGVRAVVAVATRPLAALGLYAAVLIVWHLPGPYAIMTRSDLWHVVAHGSLVAVAVLAWWPVLSPSRRLPALPYGARILYLFAFGMP